MSATIERAVAVSESFFDDGPLDEKEREMLGKEYEFVNGKPEARKMGSSRHGGVGSRLINLKHRRVYVFDSPDLIRVLTEEQDLTNEELLPGFRCPVSELFKQPAHA